MLSDPRATKHSHPIVLLLCAVCLLGLSPAARADSTTYTYTGNAFTNCYNAFAGTCANETVSMAASPVQRVLVQKVLRRSRRNFEARFPSARVACREERKAYHANIGKKRQERRRRRVMDTKGIWQW